MPHNLLQILCARHSLLHIIPGQMQQLLSGKTTQIKQTTRNGLCCGEHRTGERKAGAQVNVVFADVNHLKEGYVTDLTSGRTGDTEVQPKNINIWDINFWPFLNVFPLRKPSWFFHSVTFPQHLAAKPLRIAENKQNLCSDSMWSMIFPSPSYTQDHGAGHAQWKDGPSSYRCHTLSITPRWWWFRMNSFD